MCELPSELEKRYEDLRSKLDECEAKTREIFERCRQHNLGSRNCESWTTKSVGEGYDEFAKPGTVGRVLMIHEEHLSRMLLGLKTEEIRSKSCALGWTALCAGGTIQAITQVLHCTEERDAIAYLLSWDSWCRHRIGSEASGDAPTSVTLRSSVAAFLSELGVDSRGEHYLKYWRRPHGAARIFRWSLGPVYRVPPTRFAAAGGRTWVRLDHRISESICNNLVYIPPVIQSLPSSPPQSALHAALSPSNAMMNSCAMVEGGGAKRYDGPIKSRFFQGRHPILGGVGWLGTSRTLCIESSAQVGAAAERHLDPLSCGADLEPLEGDGSLDSETVSDSQDSQEGSGGWLSAFVEPSGSASRKRLRIG